MTRKIFAILLFGVAMLVAGGCTGDEGPPGPAGPPGADGTDGTDGRNGQDGTDGLNGQDGQDGQNGENGGNVEIPSFHGTQHMLEADFEESGKYLVDVAITGATAAADGTATVDFTVADSDGKPVIGVTGASFSVVKLEPAGGGVASNEWVPYIYRTETVEGDEYPNPDGTQSDQGYRENDGTYVDHGDGSYSYTFATDLSNVTTPVGGATIAYDRGLTHRVTVMIGGHSGPTGDAFYDFVPDGGAITETRDIVQTAACKSCHGVAFHGHGGDRIEVGDCVTCHTVGTIDAQSGNTVDFKVMIHRIHAGGELATIPGPDGVVWDDPATPADESADNSHYGIYGYGDNLHEWWDVEFPAVLENCTKCHTGAGADVDNWKNNPSRAACGSCHDDVDFAAGTNHGGGPQADDNSCAGCHPGSGTDYAVADVHDWMARYPQEDPRKVPEFTVDLSLSTPANGSFYVGDEAPVVSVVINEDGSPIDHTTIVEDDDGKEGCALTDPVTPCPARDGKFDHVYLFVHGPRGSRNPVLTTAARAEVIGGAGPFDLAGASTLDLRVDGGEDIWTKLDVYYSQIAVDVADGTFVSPGAATADEVVTWLNDDADFAKRAIAYIDEATGNVAIRSRNLGKVFSVQLLASDVTTAVFGGDTDVHVAGGSYPRNDLRQFADASKDDPKATWLTDHIEYRLDPVEDLAPGTYVVSVEIADAGRISSENYRTPSVAKLPFQVGTATEEPAVAGNCNTCHENATGQGYVLDYGRHYKIFDGTAIDQCGACHDYQPQSATGTGWGGAKPIAKRVHAVHFGAHLSYPLATVDHEDETPGRNWAIAYPRDVRYCEACHPDGTTSGSWAAEPARIPCSGCHDSQEAKAHMKLQTWDPTPENPFSGDEEESCATCH